MDVIRDILLWAQDGMRPDKKPDRLKSIDSELLHRHIEMLKDAKFIEGCLAYRSDCGRRFPHQFGFERITWLGHEFIDLLGKDSHWERIRTQLIEKGASWSVQAVLDFLRTQAGQTWLAGG